jgi:hypothetical protein
MSHLELPKIFHDDDTVYHYTTSEVALMHILKYMTLRLSPRSNSVDPIESMKGIVTYSGPQNEELVEVGKRISKQLKKVKQVSFCKNKTDAPNGGIPIVYPIEKYGFAKPRMWDRYGDNYKGVCLAFSKRKLRESIENTTCFDKDTGVEYLNYNDFARRDHSMEWFGTIEGTYKLYIDAYLDTLFYRHEDYSMENEYRICSISKGKYSYISIDDALVGLIVTNKGLNKHLYNAFLKEINYLKNVHFLILSFNKKNLRIQSYQKRKSPSESIERKLNESDS